MVTIDLEAVKEVVANCEPLKCNIPQANGRHGAEAIKICIAMGYDHVVKEVYQALDQLVQNDELQQCHSSLDIVYYI